MRVDMPFKHDARQIARRCVNGHRFQFMIIEGPQNVGKTAKCPTCGAIIPVQIEPYDDRRDIDQFKEEKLAAVNRMLIEWEENPKSKGELIGRLSAICGVGTGYIEELPRRFNRLDNEVALHVRFPHPEITLGVCTKFKET